MQHTYEVILGERLDKRNFRRQILEAGIIEETSRRRSRGERTTGAALPLPPRCGGRSQSQEIVPMNQIFPPQNRSSSPAHPETGILLIHGFTGTPKEMRWMGEF